MLLLLLEENISIMANATLILSALGKNT